MLHNVPGNSTTRLIRWAYKEFDWWTCSLGFRINFNSNKYVMSVASECLSGVMNTISVGGRLSMQMFFKYFVMNDIDKEV